jgi:hypothetical protein
MNVGFEALADHADSVADAVLRIDHEFVGEDVEDFAILGERDVASGVDGAADIVALDVARAVAKRYSAAAVDTADVAASHADYGGFNGDVSYAFGFFDGAANRAHGGIEIDDEAFAQALRFGGAQREKLHLFFVNFRDQRARFRAADVQPYDVTIFF